MRKFKQAIAILLSVLMLMSVAIVSASAEGTDVETGGYYISGTMSSWSPNADFKLVKNEKAETEEYVFYGLDLTTTAQFKVAYSADGASFKDSDWFPTGMGNNYGEHNEIAENGKYNVYFRPNLDGGEGWFNKCIYVEKVTEESSEDSSSEDSSSEASSSEDTSSEASSSEDSSSEASSSEDASSETPVSLENGFYVVGLTGWNLSDLSADCMLSANTEVEGEYMLGDVTLTAGQEFKVVQVTDNAFAAWYPDGTDNNYVVTSDNEGKVTIYFRPAGNEEWGGYIYVAKASAEESSSSEDASTDPASSEDASSEDTSTDPASSEDASSEDTSSEDTSSEDTSSEDTSSEDASTDPASSEDASSEDASSSETPSSSEQTGDTITIVYSDTQNWDNVNIYYWGGTSSVDWPGVAMTYTGDNDFGQKQYSYAIPADAQKIIFNDGTNQTEDVTIVEGAEGYYVDATTGEVKAWGENIVEPSSSEEASSGDTPVEGAWYIAGSMSGWAPNEAYKLVQYNNTVGYVFKGLEFVDGESQFKVAYSADGVKFNDSDWRPSGMGNNYGEKAGTYSATTGTYDVYFRPDGKGGEGWYEGYIYMAPAGEAAPEIEDVTVPSSEQPSSEQPSSEQPSSEPPKDIAGCTVTGLKNTTYNGKIITYKTTVKDGDKVLVLGTDYTEVYENSKNAGKATYKVYGKGAYTGKLVKYFTISKAANKMTVKASKNTYKYTVKSLSKASKTVKKIFKVSNANGTVSCKLSKITKAAKKYVKISSNGKMTIKKGLAKGNYTVKVNVTAKGGQNYKAKSKVVTFKIKVTK